MVSLADVLAHDTATPADVLACILGRRGRRGLSRKTAADLLTHPNLPEDASAPRPAVSARLLTHATTRTGATSSGLAALLDTAPYQHVVQYVHENPYPTARPVLAHLAARDNLEYEGAYAICENPAANPAEHLTAVRRLMTRATYTGRENIPIGAVVTAAARTGRRTLADLLAAGVRDPNLRARLQRLADAQDPYQAHIEHTLARAERTDTTDGWAAAVRDTGDERVAAYAYAARATVAMHIWTCPRLAYTPIAQQARLDFLAANSSTGYLPFLPQMPTKQLIELASRTPHWWNPADGNVTTDPAALEALWCAVRTSTKDPGSLLEYTLLLGMSPHTPPDVRADIAATGPSTLLAAATTYRATQGPTSAILDAIDTWAAQGPVVAARNLPMEALRSQPRTEAGQEVLTLAAHATRAANLTNPQIVEAALALDTTFPSTLGDLLDTAATIAT